MTLRPMHSDVTNGNLRQPALRSGFTLIEFVGVIAIIAILTGYGIVSVQRRLIENRREAEGVSLQGIVTGLSNTVRLNFTVPSSATWVSAVASQLNRSQSEIRINSMGNTRVMMVNPRFKVGSPGLPFSRLPYTQTIAGSREPRDLDFILLSSLDGPLPSLSGVDFEDVWDSTDDALPHDWPESWKGKPEDLLRQRVTLTGLFYRLILNNLDATNNATWGMGTGVTNNILPNSRKELWVVDGTAVDLHSQSGGLFARDILHADASYVYMAGRWVQAVVPATLAINDPAVSLIETTDTFLNTDNNTTETGNTGSSIPDTTAVAGVCVDCQSEVSVRFNGCTNSVYVTSCKDLSNVVLEMCDGTRYKYDNLTGLTGTFNSPNGQNIVRVWVKSGCYQSGDGPGYGWRVDGPCNTGNCGPTLPAATPASVVEAAFNCIRGFTTWSNNTGCSKTGNSVSTYNQLISHCNNLKSASNSCR